jgi:hypothetical protein
VLTAVHRTALGAIWRWALSQLGAARECAFIPRSSGILSPKHQCMMSCNRIRPFLARGRQWLVLDAAAALRRFQQLGWSRTKGANQWVRACIRG